MKNLKTYLTALAFSLAGVAVHANAASDNQQGVSGICFQLIELVGKGAFHSLAENGFDRTRLGKHLEHSNGSFSRPLESVQTKGLASDGLIRTPLGRQLYPNVTAIQA
ncbi:hypothetical protein ACFQDN_20260 [Pseudomonas asuensis]|jgi:hypothetical protein|uniref:Uncharacterized protein n=1 Tax=Pseudomonas asuensis TaxID=1825787 RepID=A0ABQ2H452_9PSED|nr:hypothetical protein [Pseudomonas asuensis]GGM29470.1 hypothetical protein GCM10009425_45050 [Pseudomonas asuensis]